MKDNRFLSVAVDFLFDANNKSVYGDEGFLCAVICLEALFNEGPSDISHKIAHRAALVIGLWKSDPVEVAQHLKSAYRDRNKLAHGGGSLDANQNPTRYNVIQYARTAIRIFMILLSKKERRDAANSKRKEMLLTEIDCAMLDVSRRRALQNE